MPRTKRDDTGVPSLLGEKTNTTAPYVPAVHGAVQAWREAGYEGATGTTRPLLRHWFPPDDHRLPGGRAFTYHPAQRAAIETLIYLFEITRVRRQKELLTAFARTSPACACCSTTISHATA
jgi:type III restriction enzyme